MPLSQKLRYFRGSRFSQSFILSTARLPIARYQVSFYDSNYFEELPIVSGRRFHKTLPNLRLILGLRASPNPAL